MQRPNPTKNYIIELCGCEDEYRSTIADLHHGLYETPLQGFYPFLNLNEAVAFEIGSFNMRQKKILQNIDQKDIYRIFSEIFGIGFAKLNSVKDISERHTKIDEKLNPFKKGLEARLGKVSLEEIRKLKRNLKEPTKKFVFESEYYRIKESSGGDNQGLEIMRFMPVYPKKGVHVPKYAEEIARILKTYTRDFEMIPEQEFKSNKQMELL